MKKPIVFVLSLHMLLFSIAISWFLLYQTHFLFGVFHEIGGIKEGIDKFAPLNKYKAGFADTTYAQRVEAFKAINIAVHNSGNGLADISYQAATSNGTQRLLREPEVIHLQDVANLLDIFKPLFWWSLLALPLFTVALALYKPLHVCVTAPTIKHSMITVGLVALLLACPLVIFGAEQVFNQLHIWIFPKEHQWFFYYQESLMSTLMYAPVLFGWIAAAWAVLALAGFILSQKTLNIVYRFISR